MIEEGSFFSDIVSWCMKNEIAKLLPEVRRSSPLVHQITNYVTVNDCANITLAIGASPIMADDEGEVLDIVSISQALVINIGTLNERTIRSMLLAGKCANERKIPIILDPVGAGASGLRNRTVLELLKEVKFTVIRGNASEIGFITKNSSNTKGVDVSEIDASKDNVDLATICAQKYACVVAVTGATDTVSDGRNVILVDNGTPLLKKVTGTGCMCSALIASYCGVTTNYLPAAVAGVVSMGIAGEISAAHIEEIGSFHSGIINAIWKLNPEIIDKMGKIR